MSLLHPVKQVPLCGRVSERLGRTQRAMPVGKPWHWSVGPRRSVPTMAPATAQETPPAPLQRSASIDKSSLLSLDNIREALIRQEDTIIFSLIERAQYAFNAPVYEQDVVPIPSYTDTGSRYSPLEYLLRETEQLHGKIRRYTSPDEQAFYPEDLPPLVLPPITYAQVLAPFNKEISVNTDVMGMYTSHVLPNITAPGDDNNYGSSAMYDVLALQALSKRVHYGKFVAEAKFQGERQEYTALIQRRDSSGILDRLTDKPQEKKVVARVRRKTEMISQDYTADGSETAVSGGGQSFKIDPDVVAGLFEDWIMPLTKEVEVLYLLRRLEWDA